MSEEQLIDNLMFNAEKTFETIKRRCRRTMQRAGSAQPPPDLSLMARSLGCGLHLYNFLKGFYLDPDSPTGVDNTVLAGTSMPHVLWEMQGYQEGQYLLDTKDGDGGQHESPSRAFEMAVSEGTMDATRNYDEFVRDTVNFLATSR